MVSYNINDDDDYYLNTYENWGPEDARELSSSHTEPEATILFCFVFLTSASFFPYEDELG